jgi:hypothetical protein
VAAYVAAEAPFGRKPKPTLNGIELLVKRFQLRPLARSDPLNLSLQEHLSTFLSLEMIMKTDGYPIFRGSNLVCRSFHKSCGCFYTIQEKRIENKTSFLQSNVKMRERQNQYPLF